MNQMSPAGALAVTKNLIDLERGADELLLVNSFYMRPLYVARGKERVRRVLSAAAPGLTLEGLASVCPQDVDLIHMLRDHRILIDTVADKECYDQSEIEAAAAPRSLERMTAYLLLTESCNLGCIYCLNGAASYRKHGLSKMSLEVALQSLTTCLEQLSPGGALEVAFFGGEPLLNWPLLKEVMRRCEIELQPKYPDKKITYHLTSNLTVCPPDLVEQINGRHFTVMSDVDGPADIHDRCRPYAHGGPSHARIAKTIRRLVDAGIPVALRATITSVNQDRLLDIAAHHKELGASNSAFVPVCPVDSDPAFLPDELLPDPDRLIIGLSKVYHSGLWDQEHLFPYNQYRLKLRGRARSRRAPRPPAPRRWSG